MTAIISTLRQSLVDQLTLGVTSVTWVGGYLAGPSQEHDLGCVYVVREPEYATDVLIEAPELRVRVFLNAMTAQQPAPEVPLDPVPLEEMAELIRTVLKTRQADPTIVGGYYRITDTVYDQPSQALEMTVLAFYSNVFAQGG